MYRHGDILLKPVDPGAPYRVARNRATDPADAMPNRTPRKRFIVARGEATGHHHTLVGPTPGAFDVVRVADVGTVWLDVHEASRIEHQEHATLTIPPGTYEVVHQREWTGRRSSTDPGFRRVID